MPCRASSSCRIYTAAVSYRGCFQRERSLSSLSAQISQPVQLPRAPASCLIQALRLPACYKPFDRAKAQHNLLEMQIRAIVPGCTRTGRTLILYSAAHCSSVILHATLQSHSAERLPIGEQAAVCAATALACSTPRGPSGRLLLRAIDIVSQRWLRPPPADVADESARRPGLCR